MLEYLTVIYLNPNCWENTRANFKKLIIKKGENFNIVFIKFLYLVNKAKVLKDYF